MNEDFFDELKKYINNNEIGTALEQLLNYLKGSDSGNDYNTAILISSQYNAIKKDELSGIVSFDNVRLVKAQIKANLLSFIDDIKRRATKLPINRNTTQPIEIKESNFEKIIGEKSNLKKISWVEKVFQVEKSIGRIVNNGYGTGFLTEGGWLVTNNHVIGTKAMAQQSKVQFNYQEDIKGLMLKYYTYDLDETTFETNEQFDVTKIKIKEDPALPPLFNWGFLKLSAKKASIDDHVVIIQHPQGGPKQIALTDNKIINFYDSLIHYTTDTMPGSSGSPVFNDDWEVIGLHHAGGNMRKNAKGDVIFANEAILIGKVKEVMGI